MLLELMTAALIKLMSSRVQNYIYNPNSLCTYTGMYLPLSWDGNLITKQTGAAVCGFIKFLCSHSTENVGGFNFEGAYCRLTWEICSVGLLIQIIEMHLLELRWITAELHWHSKSSETASHGEKGRLRVLMLRLQKSCYKWLDCQGISVGVICVNFCHFMGEIS